MVSVVWSLQTHGDHDLYIMSKSFHVNLSTSSPVVLEKILNDPTPFLLPPFEEGLLFYLNNFEFRLCKDGKFD
jgi:hypothetical protein